MDNISVCLRGLRIGLGLPSHRRYSACRGMAAPRCREASRHYFQSPDESTAQQSLRLQPVASNARVRFIFLGEAGSVLSRLAKCHRSRMPRPNSCITGLLLVRLHELVGPRPFVNCRLTRRRAESNICLNSDRRIAHRLSTPVRAPTPRATETPGNRKTRRRKSAVETPETTEYPQPRIEQADRPPTVQYVLNPITVLRPRPRAYKGGRNSIP